MSNLKNLETAIYQHLLPAVEPILAATEEDVMHTVITIKGDDGETVEVSLTVAVGELPSRVMSQAVAMLDTARGKEAKLVQVDDEAKDATQ